MGARVSLLELENRRIVREMRGNVNRQVNCETANINKTAEASARVIEDIEYIIRTKGMTYLSPSLREIAVVRQENPEAPLKDLGEMLDPPVGKSGVNHRLRKISQIAEGLRNEIRHNDE
jgi:DNA-binding protein WhiA